MDTVVYLIRHSESCNKANFNVINVKDDFQLTNEKTILSINGEKKAEALSKCDELHNLDAVYSSNYVRALSTAKYIASENNTIVNIDERFNERKIGKIVDGDFKEFFRLQARDFDYKASGGESLNETKKRIVEAMKNVLMFETGNRVAIISHSTALTCLLSAWCELGRNYDDEIILSYNEESIVDGRWNAPAVIKVTFEGMNVTNIEYLDLLDEKK